MFQNILGLTSTLFLAFLLAQRMILIRISTIENFWLFWIHFGMSLFIAILLKAWITLPHTLMIREGIMAFLLIGAFPMFYKRITSQ